VDPGVSPDPDSVDDATAVLVTHEHRDHLDVGHLARVDAPVYTIEAVRRAIADADLRSRSACRWSTRARRSTSDCRSPPSVSGTR
jgi:glyoxylase-like metal-dependent hydrolase (beta-lactamase superfamily II)